MIEVVNQYGRKWSDLDALMMRVWLQGMHKGNFSVVSKDGIPLLGTTGNSGDITRFIAKDWCAK